MAYFPIMMLKSNLPPLTRLWKPLRRPQMNCRLNQEWFLKSFTFESKCIALTNKFKNYVPHPKEMCVIFLVHHGFVPEFFLELFVALSQHSFIRKFIQRSFLFCNISKVDKKLPLLPPSDASSLDGTTVWRVRCVYVCVQQCSPGIKPISLVSLRHMFVQTHTVCVQVAHILYVTGAAVASQTNICTFVFSQ